MQSFSSHCSLLLWWTPEGETQPSADKVRSHAANQGTSQVRLHWSDTEFTRARDRSSLMGGDPQAVTAQVRSSQADCDTQAARVRQRLLLSQLETMVATAVHRAVSTTVSSSTSMAISFQARCVLIVDGNVLPRRS